MFSQNVKPTPKKYHSWCTPSACQPQYTRFNHVPEPFCAPKKHPPCCQGFVGCTPPLTNLSSLHSVRWELSKERTTTAHFPERHEKMWASPKHSNSRLVYQPYCHPKSTSHGVSHFWDLFGLHSSKRSPENQISRLSDSSLQSSFFLRIRTPTWPNGFPFGFPPKPRGKKTQKKSMYRASTKT